MSDGGPGAPLPVTVDRPVARLSKQFRWLSLVTMVLSYLFISAAYGVVLFEVGMAAAIMVLVGGYLLVAAPVLDIRSRGTLVTDRTPHQVHEDFRALVNPVTAIWLPWADSICGPPTDSRAWAIVQFSTLGLFTREWPLFIDAVGDDRVRIQVGPDEAPEWAAELSIRRTPSGAEVAVSSDTGQHRPRHVLDYLLQGPFVRRLMAHFGYRVREGELRVALRRPW